MHSKIINKIIGCQKILAAFLLNSILLRFRSDSHASIRTKMFFCVMSCGNHTSSFFLNPIFFKWFITIWWLMPSSWPMLRLLLCRSLSINFRRQACRTVAHLRSSLHQNENDETIVVRWKWKRYRVHKLHKFYWQHEMHFCVDRSSTVKYVVFALHLAVFSLYFFATL